MNTLLMILSLFSQMQFLSPGWIIDRSFQESSTSTWASQAAGEGAHISIAYSTRFVIKPRWKLYHLFIRRLPQMQLSWLIDSRNLFTLHECSSLSRCMPIVALEESRLRLFQDSSALFLGPYKSPSQTTCFCSLFHKKLRRPIIINHKRLSV